jgi:uncharacterized membrane protein YfcA
VLFASVLRSFTGFGFALAAMPVLSLFLQPTEAVVLSAALSLTLGMVSLRSFWGVISPREFAPLVSMSLPGTVIGTALLSTMSVAFFQLCIGLSVLMACIGITVARPSHGPQHPMIGWGVGLLSGLMNGAMAIPGPPVIVYALYTEREPRRSRALMMGFFSISAALALASYGVSGMIDLHLAGYILLALPALYAGDKLGARLFLRHGDALYRRIALVALGTLGVAITLRGIL